MPFHNRSASARNVSIGWRMPTGPGFLLPSGTSFTGPAWRRPSPPATPRMANRSFFPGSGSGSPGLLPGMDGTYTVRHPYGTETIPVTAADLAAGKGLNMTRDLGVATANFTNVLNGDVGPFLVQTAPIASGSNSGRLSDAPAGSAMGIPFLRSPAAPWASIRCPSPRRGTLTWEQATACR